MRFVLFVAGIAMAASYFVTWIEPPFAGQHISPSSVIGEGLRDLVTDGPWTAQVFLAGFALAAMTALVALMGRASGFLALLAGASPIVLAGYFYTQADDLRSDLGLPFEVDTSDLAQAWELVSDFIRSGLWMYLGGALVLLLVGMSLTFSRD